MADYTPVYCDMDAPAFSATTSGAVTGGQVLFWSGASTVGPTTAASAVVAGVAAHDAPSGGRVAVWPIEGCIHEVATVAAVTAGSGLESGASGQVNTAATSLATAAAAGTLIGTAINATTGAGQKLRFQGRR